MEKSLPCKQATAIPLAVNNWLKQPQRFKVDIRAPNADPSTQLTGHQYVDVPANLSRQFMLNFYAYKEGATSAEVHFVNEKTGEFLFYVLNLKTEPAEVIKVIEMQAPLRQCAAGSKLGDVYPHEKADALLNRLCECGPELLLFMKSVRSIEVYARAAGGDGCGAQGERGGRGGDAGGWCDGDGAAESRLYLHGVAERRLRRSHVQGRRL